MYTSILHALGLLEEICVGESILGLVIPIFQIGSRSERFNVFGKEKSHVQRFILDCVVEVMKRGSLVEVVA